MRRSTVQSCYWATISLLLFLELFIPPPVCLPTPYHGYDPAHTHRPKNLFNLRPRPQSPQQLLMHPPIPTPPQKLLMHILPQRLRKQDKPAPAEIRITNLLPQNKRPLGVFLEERRGSPEPRLGLVPADFPALGLPELVKRAVFCLSGAVPVFDAGWGKDALGHEGYEDTVEGVVDYVFHYFEEGGVGGGFETGEGWGGVGGVYVFDDFSAVHYVGAGGEFDGGDCVELVLLV